MKNAVIYPREMPLFIHELYCAYDRQDTQALLALSLQVDQLQLAAFQKALLREDPVTQ